MDNDKGITRLRQLLAGGPLDERVKTKLDLLFQMRDAVLRNDMSAQREIAQKIKANEIEIKAEKKRLPAAMKETFDMAMAVTDPDERTAKLLVAFILAAKTLYRGRDGFDDETIAKSAIGQMCGIATALDTIPQGRRSALAALLENDDVGVRANAAIHLRKIMPQRAMSILREISDSEGASSVGFTAMWSIPPKGMEPDAEGSTDKN